MVKLAIRVTRANMSQAVRAQAIQTQIHKHVQIVEMVVSSTFVLQGVTKLGRDVREQQLLTLNGVKPAKVVSITNVGQVS